MREFHCYQDPTRCQRPASEAAARQPSVYLLTVTVGRQINTPVLSTMSLLCDRNTQTATADISTTQQFTNHCHKSASNYNTKSS